MKKTFEEEGFTLIEMMIVLLIISVLILIAIPNVTKHSASIDKKGCEAYIQMVEGQLEAYKIDHKKIPTISQLANYINSTEDSYDDQATLSCPNGEVLEIDEGKVQVKNGNPES